MRIWRISSRSKRLVKEHRPDYLFHLGANSTTRHEAIFDNHNAIVTGTLNVLEAVKRHCPDCRVFITGSGVQFRNEGRPISESDPFEASSAYAVARIQSVQAARYFRSLGIAAYVGYLFHHESPLRKPTHLSKMIATAARTGEIITLGDISVRKEWTFAGDIARAMADADAAGSDLGGGTRVGHGPFHRGMAGGLLFGGGTELERACQDRRRLRARIQAAGIEPGDDPVARMVAGSEFPGTGRDDDLGE